MAEDASEDQARKDAQKAAAESLQRQIDDLQAGKAPHKPPSNLREFIQEKMAEEAKKEREEEDPKPFPDR